MNAVMVQSEQTAPSQASGDDDSPPESSPESADPDQPLRPVSDLAIDIVDAQGDPLQDADARWLGEQFAVAAEYAGAKAGRVTLAIVEDAVMTDLHQRYKAVAGTTDVLTFDLRADPREPLDVDLVLCRDQAARQARERGHDVRLELLLYAVHGLLHTLGFDDADETEAAAMHAREDDILTAIGLGPVFARREGGRDESGSQQGSRKVE